MHQNRSTGIQTILNEGITFRKILNNILAAGIFYFDQHSLELGGVF